MGEFGFDKVILPEYAEKISIREFFRPKEVACITGTYAPYNTASKSFSHLYLSECESVLSCAKRVVVNGLEFEGEIFSEGEILRGRNNTYGCTDYQCFVKVASFSLVGLSSLQMRVRVLYDMKSPDLSSVFTVSPFFFRRATQSELGLLSEMGVI